MFIALILRRFFVCVLLILLCADVQAARLSPPDPNIASLAEELAPLLKKTPDLKALQKQKTLSKKKKEKRDAPPTALEDSFSQRASQGLRLYGYNQIGKHLNRAPATGAVQDDMVLGPGDHVVVTFRGQRDDSRSYTITPQGQLIVKGLNPIEAAGMTIGALRARLEDETEKNLLNSTVFLSVKSLRQINVTVMGEVATPGVYTLSPFQTVLDALTLARGVTKNGSLRGVRVLRDGKLTVLDFYQLLLAGDLGAPIQLRDGDKIMVPVLGDTIAVAGDVKRPAIFERAAGNPLTLQEAIMLGGNPLRPGANRYVIYSLNNLGEEKLRDVSPQEKITLQDGDLLVVNSGEPLRINGVQVLGHVRNPGVRALNTASDLKTLLNRAGVIRPGIYPLMGLVERFDARTLAQVLLPFSPSRVMQGRDNLTLREQDKVMLFSTDEVRELFKPAADKIVKDDPTSLPLDGTLRQPRRLEDELKSQDDVLDDKELPPQNPLLTPEVTQVLRDHAADLNGAVVKDGLYPVAGKTPLSDVLDVAGGLRPDADKARVEIILNNPKRDGKRYTVNLNTDRPNAIWIDGGDRVVVSERYQTADLEGVTITGEVRHPGHYDLRKGDTLADLIQRAGGMTETAYASGTVFMRESERRKQEEQYNRVARELDLAIAGYFMKKDGADKNADQIRTAEKIADDLRRAKAIGRITVESDPVALQQHPEQAILLVAGDKIYVPRRPSSVNVAGEVLSPASLQHKPQVKGGDYIRMAGGTTRFADKGRSFIVFPDGSASPLGSGFSWNGQAIPAGSTIIVPRDPDPLDFLSVTSSIGNILAQLAVSSFVIAQINQ